jgi:integrase
VRAVLPPKGEARQRWLTRQEFAKLLWACWRAREAQDGRPTRKRPLAHLARFLLLTLYTGSRPGAALMAAWNRAPGVAWIDARNGVFHRLPQGATATTKRQPTVRLSDRLLAHLRR